MDSYCFNYSRLSIIVLSFILSFYVVLIIYFLSIKPVISFDIISSDDLFNFESQKNIQEIEEDIFINKNDDIWSIEIPKLNLKANIAEGTESNILDNYVGHFSETQITNGNIGLAAHNRGYNVNYFENIKELEIGDEIIYRYQNITKKYAVKTREIIKETDWNFLENTNDNRLTLITCVENMPEYRRCIQAIEKKEE